MREKLFRGHLLDVASTFLNTFALFLFIFVVPCWGFYGSEGGLTLFQIFRIVISDFSVMGYGDFIFTIGWPVSLFLGIDFIILVMLCISLIIRTLRFDDYYSNAEYAILNEANLVGRTSTTAKALSKSTSNGQTVTCLVFIVLCFILSTYFSREHISFSFIHMNVMVMVTFIIFIVGLIVGRLAKRTKKAALTE